MAKSLYFLALALLTSGAVVLAGGFAGYPTDKSVLAGLFVEAAAFATIRFRYLPDKRLLSTIKPDLLLLLLALFAYAACLNFFIESYSRPESALIVLSIVIIFPLAEELFFRDYMFHMLEAEGYPANALVFFTTLFWIGAHFHLGAWAFALIPVGVLLGLLRARSGAVIWPIIGHALYNAVLFI